MKLATTVSVLYALLMGGVALSGTEHNPPQPPKAQNADWRNILNGYQIPDEGYCDQPYVVVTKDGNWLCLLTTGPGHESVKYQHVVATISSDQGKTWGPLIDIETGKDPGWRMASWVIPLLTPSGRVYAFYDYDAEGINQMPDGRPASPAHIGWYCYRYSDDNGQTWSKQRYRLPMRVTAVDRGNEWGGRVQMFWGIDKPIVIDRGRSVIWGFTKLGKYMLDLGEGWFFRSDNILSEPDVNKLEWRLLPDGDHGVRNPEFGSVQEEHNIVELSDGTLYSAYRTVKGYPGHSVSRDGGRTWALPVPLAYKPGGRIFKQNRACPMLWKTSSGKYLFWFHHNATPHFYGRNPVWISGGIERDGDIHWAQPEILLYDPDSAVVISYPDLIEQDGKFWVTETQKTVARVHPVDSTLLEGLWGQFENRQVARSGLALELTGEAIRTRETALPRLPLLDAGGLTIDFKMKLQDAKADPAQIREHDDIVLLDWRDQAGRGVVVKAIAERLGLLTDFLRIEISDGVYQATWDSDSFATKPGQVAHVTFIIDGGANIITALIDGELCDGGIRRTHGWGRYHPKLRDANGAPTIRLSPELGGPDGLLRIYGRALRTSEAVGNFQAGRR